MIIILQYLIESIHNRVNRRKEFARREEESTLRKEKYLLEKENKRLHNIICLKECLQLEISKHIEDKGRLLGIHEFVWDIESISEAKDKYFTVYYILETPIDSDFFHLRGYVVGEWQPYMSQDPPKGNYYLKHMFRIDGAFRYDDGFERSTCRILIDHVDTNKKYQKLGLAKKGFGYLKDIAKEYRARLIQGEMYSGTREADGLSEFYRKMGFELSFEEGRLPKFKMKLSN